MAFFSGLNPMAVAIGFFRTGGELCCGGSVCPPPFLERMVPLCGRRQGNVRLKCRWYKYQLEGLSSVSLRLTAPLRREPGGNFASAEARRWTEPVWQLSNRPRHPFGPLTFELASYRTLEGRGGSVSRCDHNPKTR